MNIKIIGLILLCLVYVSCNQSSGHKGHNHDVDNTEGHSHAGSVNNDHIGNDHETTTHDDHNHEAEIHDHISSDSYSHDDSDNNNHDCNDHETTNQEDHKHESGNHDHTSSEVHSHDEINIDDGHNHASDPTHENEGVNTTVFTKEQSKKIEFAIENPRQEPFGQIIKTVAKIEPARGEESVIIANTAGIVKFLDNNILEGERVTKGQTLFTLCSGELAENNISVRLAEAKGNYEAAKANYERESELVKDKLITESEFLQAKKEYKSAEAVYNNLTRNFSSDGQLINSNLTGYIKNINVVNGQYVEAGQSLVSISQNKNLLLTAHVQQKYLEYVPSVVSANFKTLHNNKTYTFEELNGKVLSYGKSVSNNSYLIPVNLQISNKPGFVPGTLIEVYLKSVTNSKAVTVPNSSLLEEQGVFYVFVEVTPELFEKREVKIGSTDGIRTEILSGLCFHERIVTLGAIQIKLAQSSAVLDPHAGHVH